MRVACVTTSLPHSAHGRLCSIFNAHILNINQKTGMRVQATVAWRIRCGDSGQSQSQISLKIGKLSTKQRYTMNAPDAHQMFVSIYFVWHFHECWLMCILIGKFKAIDQKFGIVPLSFETVRYQGERNCWWDHQCRFNSFSIRLTTMTTFAHRKKIDKRQTDESSSNNNKNTRFKRKYVFIRIRLNGATCSQVFEKCSNRSNRMDATCMSIMTIALVWTCSKMNDTDTIECMKFGFPLINSIDSINIALHKFTFIFGW